MSLHGKIAMVTGGSRGIGRAISLALAKDGAAVALTYREQRAAAEEVVREIERGGGRAAAIALDVRQPRIGPRGRRARSKRSSAASIFS